MLVKITHLGIKDLNENLGGATYHFCDLEPKYITLMILTCEIIQKLPASRGFCDKIIYVEAAVTVVQHRTV